jgi:hypothetical protein
MRRGPAFGDGRRAKLTHEELVVEAGDAMRSGRLLTKAHLCSRWDCSDRFIEEEMAAGRLVCIQKGKRFIRFKPSDIEKWEEQCSTAPAKK